jgi:hypothetical protein
MTSPELSAPIALADNSHAAPASERVASLNSDGTLKWFIPPYIIPLTIALLVFAAALLRA